MEDGELKRRLEHDIDEMAELRADVLLLKKQLSRQEPLLFPFYVRAFYVAFSVILVAFLCVQLVEQRYLVLIYKSVSSIDEKLGGDEAISVTPIYEL